jgi:hypothetical protein
MILRMFQKTFYQQGHRSRSVLTRSSARRGAGRDGRKSAGPPAGAQEHPEPRNVRNIASSARRRPAARASRPAAVDRISADHEWSAKRLRRVGDADGTRLLAPSGVRLEPVGGSIGREGIMWAAMCAAARPPAAATRVQTGPSVSVRAPRSGPRSRGGAQGRTACAPECTSCASHPGATPSDRPRQLPRRPRRPRPRTRVARQPQPACRGAAQHTAGAASVWVRGVGGNIWGGLCMRN